MIQSLLLVGLLFFGTCSAHFWTIPLVSNGQISPVEYYIPYQPALRPPRPLIPDVSRETLEVSGERNDDWIKGDPDEQQHQIPEDETKQQPEVPGDLPETQTPEKETPHRGDTPMPYSFQYETDLTRRTETADDKGLVVGSYSYIDGAGVNRTVTYKADANGFVASGDIHPHIPTEEESVGQKNVPQNKVPNKDFTPSKQEPIVPVVPNEHPADVGRKNVKSKGDPRGRRPLWGAGGLSGWNGRDVTK